MIQQPFATKLQYYLAAAYSVLAIETHEEGRILSEIRKVIAKEDYYEWDYATGMSRLNRANDNKLETLKDTNDPKKALDQIGGLKQPSVFVMKDIHPFLNKAEIVRALRNLAANLRLKNQTVILVSPRLILPVDLQKEVQFIDYELPDETGLGMILDSAIANVRKNDGYEKFTATSEQRTAAIEAARGMTSLEADNAFNLCIIAVNRQHGKISLNGEFSRLVFEEKIINLKNSFLEYVPAKAGFETVGGMESLKEWALQRRHGFDQTAREAHLPYPRGCLITGFAGGGKTTVAMAIASQFGFPLFKFDVGKVFGSKVGESESNIREAIRLMNGIGRAVVLIDELEKSLGEQAVSGSGDNGVSSRVFGTFLSWLSEKTAPVFIVGTINNIDLLPAALQRRGRFDEIWFCDLPNEAERRQIFEVLLKYKFKRNIEVPEAVIEKTRDFVGSEIESAIEDTLYALLVKSDVSDKAFTKKLLEVVSSMTPQAQLNPGQVEKMRETAKRGFRLTGRNLEEQRPPALGRKLAINNN